MGILSSKKGDEGMSRVYLHDIMPEIKTRYALRHFAPESITREDLMPMIEAARYAPSCFNEQPERYILGDNPEDHAKLASCLVPGNTYAKSAPVLILVMATRAFKRNGKANAFHRFDSGTATAFFQLEAVRRGYGVHCMAGFDADRARELFAVGEDLDIICMMALGRPMPMEALTEAEQTEEKPGTRNDPETFIYNAKS